MCSLPMLLEAVWLTPRPLPLLLRPDSFGLLPADESEAKADAGSGTRMSCLTGTLCTAIV